MTDQTQVQRVESVLKKIRELKEEDEERAAIGEFFNVFLIDGVRIYEDTHSAILADLLSPNGSHRQGAVFLKHFLNLEPLGLADSFDYGELEDFHVKRKANSKYGEIDILLEKKDYACIIIENKIHDADDQEGQLNKYYRYAEEEGFIGEQIKLIYLTRRYGKEPSEKSLRVVDREEALDVSRVICMSYESDIVEWLEDCLKKVKAATETAPIREVLSQYQEHVKELTGLPTQKDFSMNKITTILTNDYDLIIELNKSITEAKKRTQYEFFEKLKEKITKVCGIKMLNRRNVITAKVSIFELDKSVAMELAIALYDEKLWYGFIVYKKEDQKKAQDVSKCYKDHFEKYLDWAGDESDSTAWRTGWGLGWKYLKYLDQPDQPISFSDFGTEQGCCFVENQKRKKLIEKIAKEIKNAVDKFIKAKEDAGL